MKCPACRAEMRHRMVGEVEIDLCGKCSGVFLDASEFDELLGVETGKSVEAGLDATARLPETCRYCLTEWPGGTVCRDCERWLGIRCPRDGKGMYVVEAAGVELDRCPGCKGIWVDGFERARISKEKKRLRASATVVEEWQVAAVVGAAPVSASEGGSEEAGELEEAEEPEGFAHFVEKHCSLRIVCGRCEVQLSRYTAWDRGGGVYLCRECVKLERDDGATFRALEKNLKERKKPDYWNDEEQLVETLKWAVGGLIRRGKGE